MDERVRSLSVPELPEEVVVSSKDCILTSCLPDELLDDVIHEEDPVSVEDEAIADEDDVDLDVLEDPWVAFEEEMLDEASCCWEGSLKAEAMKLSSLFGT